MGRKSYGTLREIGEAAGMRGRTGLVPMACECGVRLNTAVGWWYYHKKPEYPQVDKAKAFILMMINEAVPDPSLRAKLAESLEKLWTSQRRAA